ncbi:hypothetical protein BGZ63DRAFT_91312 [Mariannaea sp. PMI_226]|nr:hypothetical protein BGZ63DRAFT_91312 [Mariannaea sp. PMI_226]
MAGTLQEIWTGDLEKNEIKLVRAACVYVCTEYFGGFCFFRACVKIAYACRYLNLACYHCYCLNLIHLTILVSVSQVHLALVKLNYTPGMEEVHVPIVDLGVRYFALYHQTNNDSLAGLGPKNNWAVRLVSGRRANRALQ